MLHLCAHAIWCSQRRSHNVQHSFPWAISMDLWGPAIRDCCRLQIPWQYGRLQCLARAGLIMMLRVCEACVPPSAAYSCEIWTIPPTIQHYEAGSIYQPSLVSEAVSTDIFLAELGLCLSCCCKFGYSKLPMLECWNSLAGKPPINI